MNFFFKNQFLINNKKFLYTNLSIIPYIYRKLEGDSSGNNNQTSQTTSTKKQQLKELYIYIAVLAGIIILILVGYALYRKCVEKKVLDALELEYQAMIYSILNNMSSQVSSSLENSQPRSYNGNPNNINNFDMRSGDINSENDNHEERVENLRKRYGNRVLIKCLLKKQIETIEYTKKLEENYGDKCTICMDEFQVGLNIYRTPCEHIFHTNCFDKYLKGINKKDKLICPNCNQNLLINKKYMKLRAKKEEIINQRYINKEDGGKEIIIKNSLSITDHEQMDKEKEKEREKEKAEILFIRRINKNINKEIKDINEENIYNPVKLRRSENIEKKDETKSKNKRNILFISSDLKKSSDSKGMLYYSRNNNNFVNKMNSERQDILTKVKNDEEKKDNAE